MSEKSSFVGEQVHGHGDDVHVAGALPIAEEGALDALSPCQQGQLPGGHGGAEQIVARIACEEVDMLLFFRDPISAKPSEPNEMNLLRICDVHNVPVATNIATAEVLIHGLEHGDLDWRTIINPQR